jgi:hypothetical protein
MRYGSTCQKSTKGEITLMQWNKMTRDHQHIRHLGGRTFEVIDIQQGLTRNNDEVYFLTDIQYDLDSYSTDCLFDYVRLFGYSSLEDLKEQHHDDPDMYIVEAIATVTASFNRDSDPGFDSIDEAVDHMSRRWLGKAKKIKRETTLSDMFSSSVQPSWMVESD